jgi:hypothetical protein
MLEVRNEERGKFKKFNKKSTSTLILPVEHQQMHDNMQKHMS